MAHSWPIPRPAMIASPPPPVAARPQIAGVHDASLRLHVAWHSPHVAKAQIVEVSRYLWHGKGHAMSCCMTA
jgi:hypothetical protein